MDRTSGGESARHNTDPGTSAWQRARVWLLSLLPVEWLLTDCAGVSQPAVSKHLGVLKSAGLVRDRPDGTEEETNYQGANYGWQKFIVGLERVAAGLD